MFRSSSSILRAALVAIAIVALPACSEDKDDAPPTEPTEQHFTCVDDDLSSFGPFAGQGYDPAQGGLIQPAQERYMASTTLLALKPDQAAKDRFMGLMGPIFQALPTQDGLIGYELARSDKCGYARTITVWRDEEAMMAFVMSDPHVAAMSESASISTSAVVTSWEIPAAEVPPPWETARAQAAAAEPSY